MAEDNGGIGARTSTGRWILAATVLGSAMASIDATVVSIALPTIGKDFHMDVAGLQWVTTGYLLTLAGLLLFGGALGDRLGRRRVFIAGVIWFSVASLFCGVAPGAGTLIGARALQGVGGALLTPGSLAILQSSIREADRSRAIGAWAGLSGVATAVGPFVGGALISAVSWRLIFLINLPVAALVVFVARRHVPESRDPSAGGRIDIAGALLVTAGLGGLTFALVEGPNQGWASAAVVATLATGGLALLLFLGVERAKRHPMLPLGVFRSSQFTATNAVTLVVYGALGAALFLLPIELQQVAHYTPLQAGIALLPMTVIMLLLSARSGALSARIGPRLQMSVGPIVVGAGFVLLNLVGPGGDYFTEVLPAVIVTGFGLAATVAPLTATVLQAAPIEHAGVASAVNNDVARAAGLVAVAVVPPAAGLAGTSYLHPAVFSAGFHLAVVVAGVMAAAGGVISAMFIRNPVHAERREARERPARAWYSCGLDAPPLRHSHLSAHHGVAPFRRHAHAAGGEPVTPR